MTFVEARVSLQLEAEERIGYLLREQQRQARAVEDAAFAAVRDAVGGDA